MSQVHVLNHPGVNLKKIIYGSQTIFNEIGDIRMTRFGDKNDEISYFSFRVDQSRVRYLSVNPST